MGEVFLSFIFFRKICIFIEKVDNYIFLSYFYNSLNNALKFLTKIILVWLKKVLRKLQVNKV